MAEIQRQMKQQNKVFHLLVYSKNGHNGRGWSRTKPGARNSICAIHYELSWAFFLCLSRQLSRALEAHQLGLKQVMLVE